MKKIKCIFCEEEKEKAKEHIWPKWLQKHLIGTTKFKYSGTHLSLSSVRVLDQRDQSGESLVFGNVCADCNNGWMNDLEVKFNPLFKQIQNDYHKLEQLSKDERQIIALWGFKTALMINAGSNYRKIIPQSQYKHLFQNKQIPKNVKIDIAYIDSNDRLKWEQSNISFSIVKNYKNHKSDYNDLTKNSYLISMQLDKLGIKISYYDKCKELGHELRVSRDNLSLRIWPYSKNGKFNISKKYTDISEMQYDTLLIKNASR